MRLIEAVSKRTVMLLKKKNCTQYRLGKDGGIPESTLSHLINTTKKDVRLGTVWGIAATFGITLAEFFDDPLFNDIDD